MLKRLGYLTAGVLATAAVVWWAAQPDAPDAFYTGPADAPARPGVLLRQEPFDRGVPAGAAAWRILYTTSLPAGAPAVASAIVMASRESPDGPRPVVAWTHGTTGVVSGCAPSMLDDPFANVPGIPGLIAQGWIYVATDYVGQGTRGPHPYLIGEGEARSALDAIRAARQVDGLRVGDRTVVWGHSQGGHAALWTGILAPSYAPDVQIAGVAAMAPATDLRGLIEVIQHSLVGRIMSSYVLRAYSDTYADVSFDAYTSTWGGLFAGDMAGRCLAGRRALVSVASAALAGGTIFEAPPTSGALGRRLVENTPDRPVPQPLLVVQGLEDDLVLPDVQAGFVRQRCAAGQVLDYRTYAGQDHLSVVAPESPLIPELLRWTGERFAGDPPPAACRGL